MWLTVLVQPSLAFLFTTEPNSWCWKSSSLLVGCTPAADDCSPLDSSGSHTYMPGGIFCEWERWEIYWIMITKWWVVWVFFIFFSFVFFSSKKWMLWSPPKRKPGHSPRHFWPATPVVMFVSCWVMPVSLLYAYRVLNSQWAMMLNLNPNHAVRCWQHFQEKSWKGKQFCFKVQEGTGQMLMTAISLKSVFELLGPACVICLVVTLSLWGVMWP